MDVVASLEESETRHGNETRITSGTFFGEHIKMVPETVLHEPLIRGTLLMAALSELGVLYLMQVPNPAINAAGLLLGFITASFPPVLIKDVFEKPVIVKPYPDIIGLVANEKLEEIIGDGTRGFYSKGSDGLDNVYSAVDYKKSLIRVLSEQIDSESKAKELWQLVFKTPDTELKLCLIKSIGGNCKDHLQDLITSQIKADENSSPLEEAAVSYLAVKWNLLRDPETIRLHEARAQKLDSLELITAIKGADKMSREIVDKFPGGLPETLIPFVRLYTLRRIMEALLANQLPNFQDVDFVNEISGELVSRLKRSDILVHESEYRPEAVTIGMEMQPRYRDVTVMRTNINDIRMISSYAKFKKSPDKPFELVLPPTKTPVAQLLILREILLLTGVPIEQAGIQISFGGIGKRSTVIVLQRMVLSAGRLDPNWKKIAKWGVYWSIWTNPGHKGEVDVKRNDDPETRGDVIHVNPKDPKHPEFESVGEMRGAVGAESFFVFSRGLMAAHKLAGFAKAYERRQNGHDLLGVEVEMAKIYDKICEGFNEIFREKGLPEIDQKWSKKNWKKFAVLVNDEEIGDKFKKVLSEALS